MLSGHKKSVEKSQKRVAWAEKQLADAKAAREAAVTRAQRKVLTAQHDLRVAEDAANGRIAWAESQVLDAREALEVAQTPVAQLVTCLDFVILAIDMNLPCTYQQACAARYDVHAAALASVVSDLVSLGIVQRAGDAISWASDEGQTEVRDFVFVYRHSVRKLPRSGSRATS